MVSMDDTRPSLEPRPRLRVLWREWLKPFLIIAVTMLPSCCFAYGLSITFCSTWTQVMLCAY